MGVGIIGGQEVSLVSNLGGMRLNEENVKRQTSKGLSSPALGDREGEK